MKKYAIRVFTNRHHTYVQPNIEVHKQEDRKTEEGSQLATEEVVQSEATSLTLGDVLVESFPRLFESVLNDHGELEI